MKLTRYTDYAMRMLIHLGSRNGELCSIREISEGFDVSQNHMMKVAQDLVNAGYVESVRGRNGGLRLARPASEINLGALTRHTENSFSLVDCEGCRIAPACGLPGILAEATAAFLGVLDKYHLSDILEPRSQLRTLLAMIQFDEIGKEAV
jgi:Rrf2 family nitric oxide-sensitive transcriptional repressor